METTKFSERIERVLNEECFGPRRAAVEAMKSLLRCDDPEVITHLNNEEHHDNGMFALVRLVNYQKQDLLTRNAYRRTTTLPYPGDVDPPTVDDLLMLEGIPSLDMRVETPQDRQDVELIKSTWNDVFAFRKAVDSLVPRPERTKRRSFFFNQRRK